MIFPLVRDGTYSDNTVAEFTAKIKMISGTKPYLGMYRAVNPGDSNTNKTVRNMVSWCDNDNSYIDSDGIFHCTVTFKDIPGDGNCFKGDYWNGDTQTRYTAEGSVAKWGVLHIGNMAHNDDNHMPLSGKYDFSTEFIMTDAHLTLTSISGGSGGVVGTDLAPSVDNFDEGKLYSFVSGNKKAAYNNAHNHAFNAEVGKWSAYSTDEETVRQVTVADDIFDGGTHTYTKHAETDYEIEYYTCSDFGDKKFEKVGTCYSVIDNDTAKKAFVIKSHAGDTNDPATSTGSYPQATYANIFIPLNIHKYFSAYDGASGTGWTNLTEDNGNFKLKVSLKAKRLSGTGQPIVGKCYAYSYVTSEAQEPRQGEPVPSAARAYNNNSGPMSETAAASSYVTSSYNATTGAYEAVIKIESGYYKQLSRTGISTYITIGLGEHTNDGFDASATDSSFIISDIKFTVYGMGESDTALFDGANQAPVMSKANCDANTIYRFLNPWLNTDKINGTVDVAMRHAPLNKFSVEGAVQNVSLIDDNVCNRSSCTLTHHAATDTTVEYWSCATHHKNYNDEFATKEINDISATKKMIMVRDTGNTIYGAFIPMDNDGWTGDRYFIFKCKMKVFGDGVPIITGYRAGYWGGIGTFYPGDRTSQAAKDGVVTKWVNYDPETCTYTAAFYMWRADPISYDLFKYYNVTNGAHTAIMLGNFVPTSGQNPGVTANCYTTGFAFTDPEIYVATDAAAGTYSGENLCAPVTDKTVDFSTSYKYSACTQLNGSGEWTDRASNTIMNAPLRTWSKYSNTSRVTLSDIPAGYFEGTAQKRTIRASGPSNTNNVVVASYEMFIDSNTTYQFDLDYSVFGGAEPRILVQTATSSGYGNDVQVYAKDTVNGNHITYEFTSGTLRNTGDGNFRIQLGVDSDTQNKQTTVYFSNAMLRKKTGSTLGPNHLINGDFSLTPASFNGVYNTSMSDSEIAATIPYWSAGSSDSYTIGAVKGSKKYNNVTLLASSGYIFGSNDATGKSDVAVRMDGHASHGSQLQFFAGLKPSTTYRLVFNYRANGDAPEVIAKSTKDAAADPTVSKTSSWPRYGKFAAQYDITTGSDYTYSPNSNGNGNTRFIFKFGGFSQGKSLYISGVTLYELSGGNPVGGNIAGELNPILADGIYGVVPNVGDTYPVLYNQQTDDSMGKFVAVGWYGFNQASDYSTVNGAIVKVPSDFFDRNSYATRISNLSKAIIGKRAYNLINPDYDPNDDGEISVKDLVHMKIKDLNYEGIFDGATQAKAEYMLKNVIDVKNDSSGYVAGGTSWYVSESEGNNSNTGKDAQHPLKWISTANTKASAGDTIYLKRGDTWRSTSLSDDYVVQLKSGVHYAAYGTGDKPVISGSAKNYASNAWYETSSGSHIWYTTYNSGSASTNTNAAMIYFYDNKGNLSYGKSIAKKATDTTYSFSASDLDSDLEYFSPYKTGSYTATLSGMSTQGRIYVYSVANPTTRFSRIEIATDHRAVVQIANGTNNTTAGITTMNNIAVMYGGVHGIKGVSGGSNVLIKKCEVAYIGGGFSHESDGWSRLGNGIEFGDGYSNGRVQDCYVHDCYDAGVTFQSYGSSSSAYTFRYMYFERNVIERCTYNIEFFTKKSSDRMWDIKFNDNVLRNAGYGWGSYDRCDDGWRISNICGSKNNYMQITTEGSGANFEIKNNIFDCTRNAQVVWYWSSDDGPAKHANLTVNGNTYFQKKGNIGGIDSPRVMNYGGSNDSSNMKYAYSRTALIEAVAAFDDAPMGVYWLDDNY
ncbi:MAG: hypothetical protein J5852_07155 [Clostridia bacterium]|nr:hypothetical protein [Clostridia bacterium]